MMREGISKSMSKTTRGESNVDTSWERRLREQSKADAMECKDVVKMANIMGQRCGVNGGQE